MGHPVHDKPVQHDSKVEAFAVAFAQFMGTAKFIMWMTVIIIVWITINVVGIFGLKWDPYPFILLNLVFSTQASYAAPLILMAQNKESEKTKATAAVDHEHLTVNTEQTTESLNKTVETLNKVNEIHAAIVGGTK